MAKEKHQLDTYFKQKLENHEEKPSQLAWERIEDGLGNRSKKGYYIWYAAASFLLIGGIAYFLLKQGNPEIQLTEKDLLAVETPIESNSTNNTTEDFETLVDTPNNIISNSPQSAPSKTISATPQKSMQAEKLPQLIAQQSTEDKTPISLPELSLPEIPLTEATAFVEPNITNRDMSEEPSYTLTIRSSGIKAVDSKDTILEELETKVDKIGGFISKGFADLQDAKSNLFAINTPRKNRSTPTETP